MKEIGGITYSDAQFNDIEAAKNQGMKVYTCVPDTGYGTGCTNCGNSRHIGITIILGDAPFNSPHPSKNTSFIDGRWWEVRNIMYPCPMCSGITDHTTIIRSLIAGSGLEQSEMGWSLNYIDGLSGKENALSVALEIQSLMPDPNGIYTFFGEHGVGKSGILKCLVKSCALSGAKARYVRAADILQELRSTFNNNNESEVDISDKFMRYKLLAIDEVDRVSTTDWAREALFALLDKRYNARNSTCTILATNQRPDRLPTNMSYLASRMEDGMRVPVGGVSMRHARN